MEALATYTKQNQTLEIIYDECAISPREWDNLGTIITVNQRNYKLGEIQTDEIDEKLKEYDIGLILPLFMLDHSSVSLSTRDFNDKWDSGQIGYVFVTKEKLKEEYSVKRIGKKTLEKAKRVLESEIKTYGQYVNGEVYGFKITEQKNNETENIDACSGFYEIDDVFDHIGAKKEEWTEQ